MNAVYLDAYYYFNKNQIVFTFYKKNILFCFFIKLFSINQSMYNI